MTTGGVAQRIIRFSIACVGHLPGGLAIAGVFACMLFAVLSGSSPATVVAIGTIVIGGMRQVGYTKDFAAGVICTAGTLGILIPPSIVMVVYAASVEVSVGRMFLAGVIPGLRAGFMLMTTKLIFADQPTGQDPKLIVNIAKAHAWFEQIKTGQTFDQVAKSEQTSKRRIQQMIELAFLAPDIIRDVLDGKQPLGFTSHWAKTHSIPSNWVDQRKLLKTL